MPETITLTKDYGYTQYRLAGANDVTIDATAASWIVSNMGANVNRYPIIIDDSNGVELIGGTITGEVPLDMDRVDAYINSAAIHPRNVDNLVIRDWTISGGIWDGISMRGGLGANFVIDRVWISDVRDDAIENDSGMSGTISNSFFEDVFVAVSTGDSNTPSQATNNAVVVDNVLIKMKSYLNKGIITHESPFKVLDNSPKMKFFNTIVAIEEPNHINKHYIVRAWNKTVEASGSYYLNLSDKPLPGDYPMPPAGFTVLQGQAARDFYEAARVDRVAELTGVVPPVDPGYPDLQAQIDALREALSTLEETVADLTQANEALRAAMLEAAARLTAAAS